ncbi:unnamed protein product [Agarophyton chilense]
MTIETSLPVPVFNVIKYLLLTFSIDVLVRGGLDSFEHFRRRLFLYYGLSVDFGNRRIDRYNLIHRFRTRNIGPPVLLTLLTVAAYAVEISLEFSSDSRMGRIPIAGKVTRLNFTRGICSLDSIIYRTNANRFARLAEECIIHENGIYRLYRPIWTTSPEDSFRPLCEPTLSNLVYETTDVYETLQGKGKKAQQENEQLSHTMRAHSYKSNGDEERSFVTMRITSKDIVGSFPYSFASDDFTSSVFIKRLGDSKVKCFGTVYGRHGEGMMRVMMLGCTNGFTENSTLSYAQGTGVVELDVEDIEKNWIALIAVESRRNVYRFAKGVIDYNPETNPIAYAAFLAISRAQEKINVNKYAIAYRNCDRLSLPSRNADTWEETVEASSSIPRNTATIEQWAIILVICWVVFVTAFRFALHLLADRKGMPKRLYGEKDIVSLWTYEKERESLAECRDGCPKRSKNGYLSVHIGSVCDYITATKNEGNILRDRRKSFAP